MFTMSVYHPDIIEFILAKENELDAKIDALPIPPTATKPYRAWADWVAFASECGFGDKEINIGGVWLHFRYQRDTTERHVDLTNPEPQLLGLSEYKRFIEAHQPFTSEQRRGYEGLMRNMAVSQVVGHDSSRALFKSVYDVANWLRTGQPERYQRFFPDAINAASLLLGGGALARPEGPDELEEPVVTEETEETDIPPPAGANTDERLRRRRGQFRSKIGGTAL